MATLGVHCGGECSMSRLNVPSRQIDCRSSSKPCSVMMISNQASPETIKKGAVTASMPARRAGLISGDSKPRRKTSEGGAIAREKLDEWMKDSVAEIVQNLREAPLFVHVYPQDRSGGSINLSMDKGVREEDWDVVTRKWEKGEIQKPEGVIFVEELEEIDHDDYGREGGGVNRVWGLVVQGKGASCGPACYLLKTCRIASGLGCCCTHFYVTPVQSFRESAMSQLKNCWLLQDQ